MFDDISRSSEYMSTWTGHAEWSSLRQSVCGHFKGHLQAGDCWVYACYGGWDAHRYICLPRPNFMSSWRCDISNFWMEGFGLGSDIIMLHILTANPKRARLFHDKSFQDNEDVYRPFIRFVYAHIPIHAVPNVFLRRSFSEPREHLL